MNARVWFSATTFVWEFNIQKKKKIILLETCISLEIRITIIKHVYLHAKGLILLVEHLEQRLMSLTISQYYKKKYECNTFDSRDSISCLCQNPTLINVWEFNVPKKIMSALFRIRWLNPLLRWWWSLQMVVLSIDSKLYQTMRFQFWRYGECYSLVHSDPKWWYLLRPIYGSNRSKKYLYSKESSTKKKS